MYPKVVTRIYNINDCGCNLKVQVLVPISFICLVAHSIALVKFTGHGEQQFVIVGTATELVLNPRSIANGYLHVFKLTNAGTQLEWQHKTVCDELPSAIIPFQGRILVGVGKFLRIYDLGKKKLQRK